MLRFTGSRADACAAAQALYLFGAMTKAPRLYARCGLRGVRDDELIPTHPHTHTH